MVPILSSDAQGPEEFHHRSGGKGTDRRPIGRRGLHEKESPEVPIHAEDFIAQLDPRGGDHSTPRPLREFIKALELERIRTLDDNDTRAEKLFSSPIINKEGTSPQPQSRTVEEIDNDPALRAEPYDSDESLEEFIACITEEVV
jgi:hypothetical protein